MPRYSISIPQEHDDLLSIVDLLNKAVEDLKYLGISHLSHDTLLDAVIEYVAGPVDHKILFVLYDGETPVGLLAGAVNDSHPVLRETKLATEVFWYVLPDHRGNKESMKLVDAYEAWAKAVGATFASMAHFHDTSPYLSEVYDKLGYQPIEHVYIKKI